MNTNARFDPHGLILTCPQCGQRNRLAYERLEHSFQCGKCHRELRAPGEPIEVQNEAELDAVTTRASLPVVVDFWAPWCNPCKVVAPELARVAAAGAGQWLILKVNTQDLPGLAQRFEISGIPTLALFHRGREIARQSGARPAQAIRQWIVQTLAGRGDE